MDNCPHSAADLAQTLRMMLAAMRKVDNLFMLERSEKKLEKVLFCVRWRKAVADMK